MTENEMKYRMTQCDHGFPIGSLWCSNKTNEVWILQSKALWKYCGVSKSSNPIDIISAMDFFKIPHEKDIIIEKTAPTKPRKSYKKKSNHSPESIAEMKRLIDLGLSKSKISRQLKIPRTTMYYYLKEMEKNQKLEARMREEV